MFSFPQVFVKSSGFVGILKILEFQESDFKASKVLEIQYKTSLIGFKMHKHLFCFHP